MVKIKDMLPLKCMRYIDFQPGITRATLCYLWRLPNASGEHRSKVRFVEGFRFYDENNK